MHLVCTVLKQLVLPSSVFNILQILRCRGGGSFPHESPSQGSEVLGACGVSFRIPNSECSS
jgi:hypothetical protein